jgi:flagellar basal-body rod protein FlgG
MITQSLALDVNANNLANTNTDGFKASRANFQDLVYQSLGGSLGGSGAPGVGLSGGSGASISSIQVDFSQGPIRPTGIRTDVAINGPGFFQVADGEGNLRYSRAGNFTLNGNGELVLPTSGGGLPVQPPMQIPAGTGTIGIAADGTVTADGAVVGQLQAAGFLNPEGLLQLGNNLFAETGASGPPLLGNFAADGFGSLQQGALEGSNVDVTEEIVTLIQEQQVFNLNSEVVRAANQRLQLLTTLNQ